MLWAANEIISSMESNLIEEVDQFNGDKTRRPLLEKSFINILLAQAGLLDHQKLQVTINVEDVEDESDCPSIEESSLLGISMFYFFKTITY